MNEYMKPDYEVMVFEANEYVAACAWEPGSDLTLSCGFGGKADVEISTQYGNSMPGNAKAWNVTYEYIAENGDGSTGSGWIAPIYKNTSVDPGSDGFYGDTEFKFTGQYGFYGIVSDDHNKDTQAGENMSWYPDNGQGESTSPYYLAYDYNPYGTGFQWLTNYAFHLVTSILNKNNS